MPNELNTMLAEQYKADLGTLDNVVAIDPSGLDSEKMAEFRKKLRESKLSMEVVKNRIAVHALKETGLNPLVTNKLGESVFAGTTGLIFGGEGAIDAAKFTTRWMTDHKDTIKVKGGQMGPDVFDASGVAQIATLPGKKELLSQMAAGFAALPQKLAATMQAGYSKLLWGFAALEEKLAKAGK
ncbi:MAG: 50S ribosomal protein L10 [Planctomycetes bacterium]|nr:50S ribosomal protein L10 [Planctomycetota bacterium]